MSKKQTTWLIVAAAIFVVTGVISVITNAISDKLVSSNEEKASSGLDSLMSSLYGGDNDICTGRYAGGSGFHCGGTGGRDDSGIL